MRPVIRNRALAVIVSWAAAIALASTAVAQPPPPPPPPQVPGNGVFQVGPGIAPGTYHSPGPTTPLVLIFGNVAPVSFCSWSIHSTPDVNDHNVIDANTSLGPMYAKIPDNAAAFKTENCHFWTRVS